MSDFQKLTSGVLALLPCMCALPKAAVAQSIEPIAGNSQTVITTEGEITRIEGGIQADQNLFHRFDSFDVAPGQTADFVTPASVGSVIGQVSGGSASYIDGTLQVSGSNADLYLINPAGVLFGPDARLNVGGSFNATTADQVQFGEAWLSIQDADQSYSEFSVAPTAYRFTAERPGVIVNQGDLAVSEAAAIRLSGGTVVNSGTLGAPAGEVSLNAVPSGSLVRLNAAGALLNVEVDAVTVDVAESGGAIAPLNLPTLLTGGSQQDATDLEVNDDGSVTLSSREYAAVAPGTVLASGQIDVSSHAAQTTGGAINLLGDVVDVVGAQLRANGDAGGGLIHVGGDYQGRGSAPTADTVFFDAEASADALSEGDGGEIVVWSDGVTQFSGLLSAKGAGDGSGGLVETSGLENLVIGDRAHVDTRAESGHLGTWLLDPVDLSVVASGGTSTISGGTNSAADSRLDVSSLVAALNSTNVTLQATNSISIDTEVNASGTVGDLHLQAPTLTLAESISLGAGNELTGTASTVNLGANGSLRNAIDAVATGGTVQLASAVYRGGVNINRDMSLVGQGADNTVLSGENSLRVLSISNGNVAIDNLAVKDGVANGGGGIHIQGTGSLQLSNSLFVNNESTGTGHGGGLFFDGAGVSSIQNTRFENNRARNGGAISLSNNHSLNITDTDFVGNRADDNGGALYANTEFGNGIVIERSNFINNQVDARGGAISVRRLPTLDILDSVFENNNSVAGLGGAINSFFAPINIDRSTFRQNFTSLTSDSFRGGAISSSSDVNITESLFENNRAHYGGALNLYGDADSTIVRTTFDGNQSISDGGAINMLNDHRTNIEQTTISNNTSDGDGGGIKINGSSSGSLTVLNSTISGNTASRDGGGIDAISTSQVDLTNVTIANNQAGMVGGGVQVAGSSQLRLGSSIIAGNRAGASANDVSAVVDSLGRNIVQDRGNSTGYISTDHPDGTDPLLNALADNGGLTQTHSWRAGSLAEDGGVGIGAGQRGFGATGPRDIGAYERLSPSSLIFTSGIQQSTLVNTAFDNPVEVMVTDRFGVPLDGQSVSFSTGASTANANFLTATTQQADANGLVSVRLSANTASGTVALTASAGSAAASSELYNVADTAQDLVITGLLPVAIIAGDSAGFTVNAIDRFGNIATDYAGSIQFISSDPQAQLPSPTVLTGGTRQFFGEPRTAGTHSLVVSDLADASLSATQNGIVVVPGAPSDLALVSGGGQSTLVDTPFSDLLTIKLSDRFNNAIAGESVLFSAPTTGAGATFGTPTVTTNGVGEASTQIAANSFAGVYGAIATTGTLTQSAILTNTAAPTPGPDPNPGPTPPQNPVNPSNPEVNSPNEPNLSDLTLQPTVNPLSDSLTDTERSDDKDGRSDLFDEQAFTRLEQSLTEEYARYWQRPLRRGADLESVQQILQQAENDYDSRSAIVYAVFVPPGESAHNPYASVLSQRLINNEVNDKQDQLMLLLIPPEGNPIQQRVDVTRQQLQRQAQLLNIEISSFFGDGYQPLARQLYDWLLTPIEDDIQAAGVDDLMYVLDEGLSTVPLPALMTGDTYAIERYGLSILPSVGLLRTDFGEDPAAQTVLAAGAETFHDLEALPAVPVELALVEASATSSEILLNESFGIENVAASQARDPKTMMHVATHAFFNPGSIDHSYIQFWEEQLNLEDLDALDLQDLELLILSACTTAIGSREAELGFAGLAAATGVESSIGSLWNVSDVGTMALMAEFYEQLKENPLRAVALQEAQRSLLQGNTRVERNRLITQSGETPLPDDLTARRDIDLSHPFFWSGFTLVGNPWW